MSYWMQCRSPVDYTVPRVVIYPIHKSNWHCYQDSVGLRKYRIDTMRESGLRQTKRDNYPLHFTTYSCAAWNHKVSWHRSWSTSQMGHVFSFLSYSDNPSQTALFTILVKLLLEVHIFKWQYQKSGQSIQFSSFSTTFKSSFYTAFPANSLLSRCSFIALSMSSQSTKCLIQIVLLDLVKSCTILHKGLPCASHPADDIFSYSIDSWTTADLQESIFRYERIKKLQKLVTGGPDGARYHHLPWSHFQTRPSDPRHTDRVSLLENSFSWLLAVSSSTRTSVRSSKLFRIFPG